MDGGINTVLIYMLVSLKKKKKAPQWPSSFEGWGVTLWQNARPLLWKVPQGGKERRKENVVFHRTIAYDFKY